MGNFKVYEVYNGWAKVGETTAVSPAKAIANMKYRLGTKFGNWSAVEKWKTKTYQSQKQQRG